MKNILGFVLLSLFLAAPARAYGLFDGDWDGVIARPGRPTLHLRLHVEPGIMVCSNNNCGTYPSAELTGIDPGGAVTPVADISQNGYEATFNVPAIKGSIQATLSADYMTLAGTWNEDAQSLPLTLTRRVGQVDRIDILTYGTADPKVNGSRFFNGWQVATTTTIVPAQLGASFGISYSLMGAPNGTPVPLRAVTVFPKEGLRNPATGKIMLRSESDVIVAIGGGCYHYYRLDSDWEVVPGTWVFQIWYQGRKLAEKSFTVVKP